MIAVLRLRFGRSTALIIKCLVAIIGHAESSKYQAPLPVITSRFMPIIQLSHLQRNMGLRCGDSPAFR
jgi:hypothetical protein